MVADGEQFSTSPARILAKESLKGDLLYVRLAGDPESAYVGEPVDATLEIWLKPFRTTSIRMGPTDMWLCAVDEQASTWSPIIDSLEGRFPHMHHRTETRMDANGRAQEYFVYSLTRKLWPERPGIFKADGVNVVVNYPLKVRSNSRRSFSEPYQVLEARPISAAVGESNIVMKAVPKEGRPESYRGAVGEYTIATTATPTRVSVGDPITLTLAISGTGR